MLYTHVMEVVVEKGQRVGFSDPEALALSPLGVLEDVETTYGSIPLFDPVDDYDDECASPYLDKLQEQFEQITGKWPMVVYHVIQRGTGKVGFLAAVSDVEVVTYTPTEKTAPPCERIEVTQEDLMGNPGYLLRQTR